MNISTCQDDCSSMLANGSLIKYCITSSLFQCYDDIQSKNHHWNWYKKNCFVAFHFSLFQLLKSSKLNFIESYVCQPNTFIQSWICYCCCMLANIPNVNVTIIHVISTTYHPDSRICSAVNLIVLLYANIFVDLFVVWRKCDNNSAQCRTNYYNFVNRKKVIRFPLLYTSMNSYHSCDVMCSAE